MVGRIGHGGILGQAPELQAASQPGGVQVRSMEGQHLRGYSKNEEERVESKSSVEGVTWEWVDLGYQRGKESERMLRFGVRVTRRLERWKSARQTLVVLGMGSGIWM